jgi:DNA-binding HxlR family transcriptional regulator
MATTADPVESRSPGRDRRTERTNDALVSESDSAAPATLDLLDDEYAREILLALTGGPQRGRDLAAACEASRPTVYRRVNSLEDAGLVTTETSIDPDGHHCKEFRLVRDRLTVTFADGTITVTARASSDESESAA